MLIDYTTIYNLFPDCKLIFYKMTGNLKLNYLYSIECHRCVLSYNSDYFTSLFENNFKKVYKINEKDQYEYDIIVPYYIRSDVIEKIIYFIYSLYSKVDINDDETIDYIEKLSDHFMIKCKKEIIDKCIDKYTKLLENNFEEEKDYNNKFKIMEEIIQSKWITRSSKENTLYCHGHLFHYDYNEKLKTWENELNCVYYRSKSCKEGKYIFIKRNLSSGEYNHEYFEVDNLKFYLKSRVVDKECGDYDTYDLLEVINNTNKNLNINIFITDIHNESITSIEATEYGKLYEVNYNIPISSNNEKSTIFNVKNVFLYTYSQIIIELLN